MTLTSHHATIEPVVHIPAASRGGTGNAASGRAA